MFGRPQSQPSREEEHEQTGSASLRCDGQGPAVYLRIELIQIEVLAKKGVAGKADSDSSKCCGQIKNGGNGFSLEPSQDRRDRESENPRPIDKAPQDSK